MTTKLIALSGPAGSGKSAAASYLASVHGYHPVKFAGPLKAMLRAYYVSVGLEDPEQIERRIEGDLKEVPDPLLNGYTPRHAMQTLGTEWGRDCLGQDFWVRAWRHKVDSVHTVVTDDCRFNNEAEAVKAAGGIVIRLSPDVHRRASSGHVSETPLYDTLVDHEVVNDGTVDDLRDKISDIIEPIQLELFGPLAG